VALLWICLWTIGMGTPPPQLGGPAPDFRLESFDGKQVALSELRGKVVLVNFWASWCEPCKKEMPQMEAAYQAHRDEGLVVLGINFGEKKEAALRHIPDVTFPLLLDRKTEVAEKYGVTGLPVTFYISPDGVIRERISGGLLTRENISAAFTKLRTNVR
jgi:peroxiredoxin